jgi:hypothetical protein
VKIVQRRRRAAAAVATVALAWSAVVAVGSGATPVANAAPTAPAGVATSVPGTTELVSADAAIEGGARLGDLSANGETIVYELVLDADEPGDPNTPRSARPGRSKQAGPTFTSFRRYEPIVALVRRSLENELSPPLIVTAASDDPAELYNGHSPAVDDRGDLVAFAHGSMVLIPTNDNKVFVRDLRDPARQPIEMPVPPLHRGAIEPSLSGDGTTIAFVSRFDCDPEATCSPTPRVVVVDLDRDGDGIPLEVGEEPTGADTTVVLPQQGSNPASTEPQLDGDGSHVVFTSDADDRVATIVVADLTESPPAFQVVSQGDATPNADSLLPSIDRSGTVVAFVSQADNLVPPPFFEIVIPSLPPIVIPILGPPLPVPATFLVDLEPDGGGSPSIEYVAESPATPSRPDVAPDGSALAFTTTEDLTEPDDGDDDTNDVEDVYVRHLGDGRTERASVPDGTTGIAQATSGSSGGMVNDGARFVAFGSRADVMGARDLPQRGPAPPPPGEVEVEPCEPPTGTNEACDTADVYLRIRPAPVSFVPDPATFPTTAVGMSSAPIQVAVTNDGTAMVDLRDVFQPDPTDPDSASFVVAPPGNGDCDAAARLDPGESCLVTVTFVPTAIGPFETTVDAPINDRLFHDFPDITSAGFGVIGDAGSSRLIATPSPLDLGNRKVDGGAVTGEILVTNVADDPEDPGVPVTISGVDLGPVGPPGAADFQLVPEPEDCTAGTILVLGGSCRIHVRFSPTAVGLRAAGVQIASDASDASEGPTPLLAPVIGRGVLGGLVITPDPLDLGGSRVGVPAPPGQVALTATGDASVVVSAVSVGGADPGDFSVGPSCVGVTLEPGGPPCVVDVGFTPTGGGPRTATIIVGSDAVNDPTVGVLRGTGLRGALVIEPDPLDLGSSPIGSAAPTRQVLIRSVGSVPVDISSVTVAGPAVADFTPSGFAPCLAADLPPGGSCTADVTFTPSASGLRTASIVVGSDAETSPTVGGLRGTGTGTGPAGVADFVLEPPLINFGLARADSIPPTDLELTGRSTGTAPVTPGPAVLVGVDAFQFAITQDGCNGVTLDDPADRCTILVAFRPRFGGVRTADVQVPHDGVSTPATSTLVGEVEPVLEVNPGTGGPGSVPTATGRGFPPNATVVLRWVDHPGSGTVVADGDGRFAFPMLVIRQSMLGPRQMEATTTDILPVIPVDLDEPFLVVPGTFYPPGRIFRS